MKAPSRTRTSTLSLSRFMILLALGAVVALAQQAPAPGRDKSQAVKAEKDSSRQEARRAWREAQREVTRAQRDAQTAPRLAGEDWEEGMAHLSEVPWPELAPRLERARATIDRAQARLHRNDFAGLDESMAHLASVMALHGVPPPAIPPLPMIPSIPPLPPMPPMPAIVGLDACHQGWTSHGSYYYSTREYDPYLSEDERVRVTALGALINQDENTAFGEIKTLLKGNLNWAMRAAAVELLGCIDNKEAVTLLHGVLRDESDQRVRLAAVRALAHHDEPEARAALQELLQK